MQDQLLNSNNLKEKLKSLGQFKEVPPNIQDWLNTVAHKHWLKLLPQENFNEVIDEPWFKEKMNNTRFKQLVITPQLTSEVNHLIDFLKQNYQIKTQEELIYKPLNKLNYLECQRQAQKWMDNISDKALMEEDTLSLKVVEELTIEGEKYTLYDLGSRQNLLREGKLMNNCISTYAEKTDEELKNRKFLSLRDSDNKSLVNIGLIVYPDLSDLERETFIHIQSQESLKNMEQHKKYDERHEATQTLNSYESYKKKMFDERGFIYSIDEIKEKNNEILSNYETIVQIFLNKVINKIPDKKSLNINSIHKNCSEQMSFFHLKDNKRQDIFALPSHREINFLNSDELTPENFLNIDYIPPAQLNKLKNKILNNDFSVPLILMAKTKWINLFNYQKECIKIAGDYENLTLKDIKSNSITIKNQLTDTRVLLESLSGFNKASLEIELNLGSQQNETPSHISLNRCTPAKLEISNDSKSVKELNLLIKDSKMQELVVIMNKSPRYQADHMIYQNISGSIIVLDSDIKYRKIEAMKMININTQKSTLNNSHTETFDMTSFVKEKSPQGLNAFINSQLEYSIKKMQFTQVTLNPAITKMKVLSNDYSDIRVEIPVIDKELILSACSEGDGFKQKVLSMITTSSLILQEYEAYKSPVVDNSFLNLLEHTVEEIKIINEKYKDDPNSINYLEPLSELKNEIFKSKDGYIYGSEKEKLELLRDALIENMESTRVNNSRTKVTKAFANNLLSLLSNDAQCLNFSESLKSEILETLKQPTRLRKSPKHTM